MNDVLISKKVSMERCISQVERYQALPRQVTLAEDFMAQDAISMNIQRACELGIDMANILIRNQILACRNPVERALRFLFAKK